MNLLNTLKLRGPRVLIRQLSGITMRESGIILTETQSEEMHFRGLVERVGPGERQADGNYREVGLGPGDLVYFAKFAGSTLVLEGQHRLVLMEDEIQAAIDAVDVPPVVQHLDEQANGGADHLFGEPCPFCRQKQLEAEAAERATLQASADAVGAEEIERARQALRARCPECDAPADKPTADCPTCSTSPNPSVESLVR